MPFMQGVLTVKVVEASQLPLQNTGSVDPFGLVSRKALGVNNKIKAYVKVFLDDIHLRYLLPFCCLFNPITLFLFTTKFISS